MGIGGHAIYGMCLGSQPGEQPADAEGLAWLDRHEVAHCVLSSFMPTDIDDPPSVLSEGWAQANQGDDEKTVALRAWEGRERAKSIPLRELTGPVWYNRHHWPAYLQGAALVNYILRKLRPRRSSWSCSRSCRPATFADDFQRILGVSLDELDAAYWAEVKQTGRRRGDARRAATVDLRVRPPVEPAAWNAFLDEYFAADAGPDRPLPPRGHDHRAGLPRSRTSTASRRPSTHRIAYRRSGDLMALEGPTPTAGEAYLATPAAIVRGLPPGRASPLGDRRPAPRRPRPGCTGGSPDSIAELDPLQQGGGIPAGDLPASRSSLPNCVDLRGHAASSGSRRAAAPCVRAAHRGQRPRSHAGVAIRSRSCSAADDKLAVRSSDIELHGRLAPAPGVRLRPRSRGAHPPLLSATRSSAARARSRTAPTTVVDRRFGPVPASEFTEERLLDGPATHTLPVPDEEHYKESPKFGHVYRILLPGA